MSVACALRDRADWIISKTRAAFAVSPHGSNALPRLPNALYVDTGVHLTICCADDTADVAFRNVTAAVRSTRAPSMSV